MDLVGRAIRFRQRDDQFQVDSPTYSWEDPASEPKALSDDQLGVPIDLNGWEFPFSGQKWKSLQLNATGSISFGSRENIASLPRYFYYKDIAGRTIQTGPILAPLWRRYGAGATYSVQQRESAVVITFQFEEAPTDPNRFLDRRGRILAQTVLDASGTI